MTQICVDVLAYINDCHDRIPETDREWIADKIARKFDCSQIYDDLDDWVWTICKENNIKFEEENDSN